MPNPNPFAIRIPYPTTRWMKQVAHAPLFLWRLGLGFLFGDLIMLLTTTGRKSDFCCCRCVRCGKAWCFPNPGLQ